MQSVKYFLRTFGSPNPEFQVVSAAAAEEELNFQYLSQGWAIETTQYLGSVKDRNGNEIGYRIFHVLVKSEDEKPVTVREPVKKDK